ncbi:MAG TPA: helix-turn-helix transcriptional regulator [Spirochaetota bacterium]|nr:helix-turn-helix transcriptional regulator [Spirochaetota bacterium]HPL16501.1 helix-turn-helix transcriptional regulator [Spirochaetota bacterium]HRS77584.1 helix-turn-helix transcriptional regulator [Spirochaetota bacterium]HRT75151.1 helix-turn-helix transcriptional regulator [Spirochaetota bacterium]
MSIIFRLDRVMADRKMSLNELARRIQLTDSNLSILKTGKAKAIRVLTLDAICRELNCQPGDLLEYQADELTMDEEGGGTE